MPRYATPFCTTVHASQSGHAGGDLIKIQAHIRGRYQRRLVAKSKREARRSGELEKMEASGQLPPHRGAVVDEYDEFGNKKVTFC